MIVCFSIVGAVLNPSCHANSLVAVFTPIWSFLCSFVACMRCGLVCGFDTVSVLCARSVGIVDDQLLTCGRRRVGIGMAAFHCVGIAFVFGVVCPFTAHGFELDARASGGQSSDSVGAFNGSYVVGFFIIVCHGFVLYFSFVPQIGDQTLREFDEAARGCSSAFPEIACLCVIWSLASRTALSAISLFSISCGSLLRAVLFRVMFMS